MKIKNPKRPDGDLSISNEEKYLGIDGCKSLQTRIHSVFINAI